MARPLFADPKTDLIFKRIFGRKANRHLLIALLNDLLDLPPERRIVSVEHLSPEQLPTLPGLKRSIVDVKCEEASGRRYIVEMQVNNQEAFEKRMVYNASRDYADQIQRGDQYPDLNDVVLVAICSFRLWWHDEVLLKKKEVPMVSRWSISEETTGERRLGQVRYVVLELPKYQGGAHPKSMIDRWAYFFRETEELLEIPTELSEGPLREALEVARLSGMTAEELAVYEREKIAEQDARGMLTLAEREGEARGEMRGRDLGLKEGKDLGLKEALVAVLRARGVPLGAEAEQRIRSCDDPVLLSTWLVRAATCSTVEQVLDS